MGFIRAIFIILAILVLWDVAWWLGFGVSPYSPWELRSAIEQGESPTIIDVRTRAEYDFFHIPGAVNVPYPASLAELAMAAPDPSRPVVVICMSGHRSPPVAHQMQQGGYTDVKNLTWGMLAWKLFGGMTVGSE